MPRKSNFSPPSHPNEEIRPRDARPCPVCRSVMETEHAGLVEFNICKGHGVWADCGELEQYLHAHIRRGRAGGRVRQGWKHGLRRKSFQVPAESTLAGEENEGVATTYPSDKRFCAICDQPMVEQTKLDDRSGWHCEEHGDWLPGDLLQKIGTRRRLRAARLNAAREAALKRNAADAYDTPGDGPGILSAILGAFSDS